MRRTLLMLLTLLLAITAGASGAFSARLAVITLHPGQSKKVGRETVVCTTHTMAKKPRRIVLHPGSHVRIGTTQVRCARVPTPKTPAPVPQTAVPVTMAATCAPNPVQPGQQTTCTLTTVGNDGSNPTGTFNVNSSGPGSWGSFTCAHTDVKTVTCTVLYTPATSSSLTQVITFSYEPSDFHSPGQAATTLNVPWFPSGFTLWTGAGNGSGVVADAPSSCSTLGGGSVANGERDPLGRMCFAYLMVSNKDCLNDIYASANIVSAGVVVGYTNDLEHVSAGQEVLMHSVVYDAPGGATLQLTQIDCN